MITKVKKTAIIEKFATHKNDVGSTPVQFSILTERIKELTEHLKNNKNDIHTKTGLIRLTGQRKRMLAYLKRTDFAAYAELIKAHGLKK